jgi:glycosyltransferase involved in cell wall biosynthesis
MIKDSIADTGGTRYFLQTVPQLDPARVRATVAALRARHAIAAEFQVAGIPAIFLGRAKWDPRSLLDLLRLIRAEQPDVLHLEGKKTLLLGRIAARLTQRPVIAHFHSMVPMTPGLGMAQRRLTPRTATGLAVSKAVRNWAMREFAFAPERIEVLYNGLDIDRFVTAAEVRARVRQQLQLGDQAPVVGLIGRIKTADKGQDLMIRAMPGLLKMCPDAALLVVGDGPDRPACERLAAQLGLETAVRFAGHRNDIPEVLAAVDQVVVPSTWDEGFGYVALEALAAGRPVVAFRSGGLPEIVEDGVTGILVPKGDVPGLAGALARLASDPDLARALAEAGRRSARRFTVPAHVERLMEVYDAVAAAHHADGSSTT